MFSRSPNMGSDRLTALKVLDEGEARSDEEWVVVSTADSYRYHVRLEAKA